MANIAKKGSGQINLSREVSRTSWGGPPMNPPGAGGSSSSGEGGTPSMTKKGSGQITVDRSVTKPPTKAPAK